MLLVTLENHWRPKDAKDNEMKQFVWHYLTNLSLIDFMIYYGEFRANQSAKYEDQESWWNVLNCNDVGEVTKKQALILKQRENLAFRMLIKNKETGKLSVLLG
ncbi:MAG: hypothetical protein HQL69_12765 [Magnetococcales bacterium]|nr:hypothetical protein [Magnetococcales bacterium]